MLLTKSRISDFKIEPYELCPCNSGDKFKFCCYKEAKAYKPEKLIDKTYSDARISYLLNHYWKGADFKTCFGFDKEGCNGQIKGAHSIQNNRILNRISEAGHVYTIGTSGAKEGVSSTLDKISKNKASTFFGFCDLHDTELFRPIEIKEYNEDPIQNFLFAFRAHSIEHHKKLRKLNSMKNIFKESPGHMLDIESVYMYRVAQFDVRDCESDYVLFRNNYKDKQFKDLRTIYRKLDYEVGFAVCSSFAIEHDLNGNLINNIYSVGYEHMPSIYMNIYPTIGGTNIILSYHTAFEGAYKDYFDQFEKLSEENLLRYLNYLIINYTENVFFNPSYIESLSSKKRDSLLRSFESSIYPLEVVFLLSEDNYFEFNLFDKSID